MNLFLKNIYRNLLPARLKNSFDLFSSLRGTINHPTRIEKPEGSRILVLSPHPDDDIYGCGGVLHQHHLAGAKIVSVYMTDGRKGGTGVEPEEEIKRERKKEAQKAGDLIGIDRMVFMDQEDSHLVSNKETISQMGSLMKEIQPDIVYVPFLIDFHPDHLVTNEILVKAMKEYKDVICYGYEVWTPLLPNCFVDISDSIEIKRLALLQFETQTKRFNMVDASLGLGKYRSVMHSYGDYFVESFFRCSSKEYSRLWRLIH